MARRPTIATAVHAASDFLPRVVVREGDDAFVRASGDCVCAWCGREYRKHPLDPYELYDGWPWLTVLCDGRRVKL